MPYQNIDIKNNDHYIAVARLFKKDKLFGYKLQKRKKLMSEQTVLFDVSKEQFNELVKAGLVDYVKMTASGPRGYSVGALTRLKSITLNEEYKVIAGLRIWRNTIISYIIQYNGDKDLNINGVTVHPHEYFIERADNLNWILPLSNMEDIRIINKVNDLTICYPVISSENLKDFIGTIDIEVEELDHSHAYIREPYVYNKVIREAMKMIKVPSSYICDINYETYSPFSPDEEARYNAYMQHILAMDVKSRGNFKATLQEAKIVRVRTEVYLDKFRDTPLNIYKGRSADEEFTIEDLRRTRVRVQKNKERLAELKRVREEELKRDWLTDIKQGKQQGKANSKSTGLKPRKKGIAGIFDIFRHRNTK